MNPTLRLGDRGRPIEDAQRLLRLPVNGYFGPVMEEAVRLYQWAHRLDVTGQVDGPTWEALERGRGG